MAENKKSFIAYSDWYGMLKACPDEVAGKLIKHVFAYVNDENPSTDDFIINALFEQIKCTLKRDLVKWEKEREQRSLAGKKSAEQRATKFNERSTLLNENERNITVSDNVNENVIVSDFLLKKETKKNIFSFKKKLIEYGFDEKLVSEWLLIRKNKKATNTETAFDNFIKEIESRPSNINDVLRIIVTNSWSGFKYIWIDNLKNTENGKSGNNKGGNTTPTTDELAEQSYSAVAKLLGRTQ